LHYLETGFYVSFDGVPIEKINLIREKFFQVLKNHIQEGIDMARIQLVISRDRLKLLNAIETDPPNFFVRYFWRFLAFTT
jgi:Zn-dependent M16 (insulinase) family peptidase